MAREFKDYDVKYAKYKGVFMDYELADGAFLQALKYFAKEVKQLDVDGICGVKWLAMYTTAQIRYAVYEAESAEDWQKFRVSLKGNTTGEKLMRLKYRYEKKFMSDISIEEKMLEKIRYDNYIGALRRGGQLNAKYEVAK